MQRVRKANVPITIECPFDFSEPKVKYEIISCMDFDRRAEIYDLMTSMGENRSAKDTQRWCRFIVQKGLIHIENLLGADDLPLSINSSGVTDAVCDALQEVRMPQKSGFDNALSWLGTTIWKHSTLDEETKKNSDSLSDPSTKGFIWKPLTPSTNDGGLQTNLED